MGVGAVGVGEFLRQDRTLGPGRKGDLRWRFLSGPVRPTWRTAPSAFKGAGRSIHQAVVRSWRLTLTQKTELYCH